MIVYAQTRRNKQYSGAEHYLLISQTLTEESHLDFTDEELFPLADIVYSDPLKSGGYGPILLFFKNGRRVSLDFDKIEGSFFA